MGRVVEMCLTKSAFNLSHCTVEQVFQGNCGSVSTCLLDVNECQSFTLWNSQDVK